MTIKLDMHSLEQSSDMFKAGVSLIRTIESIDNYTALMVGGTPRDILIGRTIHDIDIATNCPMDVVESTFKTFNVGKSKDFGIVVVIYEGHSFEIAQFRSDGEYTNNRHPDGIAIIGNFKTDSNRRDFTCNSLGLDSLGNVIDYHGGIEDIKNKKIKAVGNPDRRFSEDFVRMLRAARFVATLDFTLETSTRIAIRRLSHLILKAAPERIMMEFIKASESGGKVFAKFINSLSSYRLLSKILPEVDSLHYYYHKLNHHPEGRTVYEHVIKAVEVCRGTDPTILMAVLLHDVGKAISLIEIDGYPKYHGHDRSGYKLIQKISARLKFPNDVQEAIEFSTRNHMKFHHLSEMKKSKIARLVSNKDWNVLKEVGRADEFSRGPGFKFAGEFDAEIKSVELIRDMWQDKTTKKTLSIVSGKMIMDVTGESPGPLIGKLKNILQDIVIDEHIDYEDYDVMRELIIKEYTKTHD